MQDLIVIGGGPAGMSAALNGAAEGLTVTLLEREDVLGGQAGTSSRIENYLGFPGGVSGDELTRLAQEQARMLGADLRTGEEVIALDYNDAVCAWRVTTRERIYVARMVLLATGVEYRRLGVPGEHYPHVLVGAPASMHPECAGKDVVVIGGGNSAGQAALNVARYAKHVRLLVRRPLGDTMSAYLIDRIAEHRDITVNLGSVTEVTEDRVIVDHASVFPADCVLVHIGSVPHTDFAGDAVELDDKGFVRSIDFMANANGLFVAGDIRSGSSKRVAVATGEGALSASGAWRHLHRVTEPVTPTERTTA